jgi:hemin uptake protein HemP
LAASELFFILERIVVKLMPKTQLPVIKGNQLDGKKLYSTREIFAGSEEVLFNHKGVIYRLSITKQDKLILTK